MNQCIKEDTDGTVEGEGCSLDRAFLRHITYSHTHDTFLL